ncbi:Ppx/GppA family phosphatase [Streptomyces sp. PTM05]|uniref:Ppx/GppA family phosphatase n=1 Tax=Streptantibioticus parmotrematis TaxID=2873249 RepID=A0ABS7QZK1_9ACTN|nr:Ppx/GppA phosphatase family protein [Streptantibioticus parmotrematis]MBY8887730.1 Ppx/GppA family phosphatase [Streptantibioticus parmotrematis]
MTRVAAIDCGTNSIRLLIADVDPATGSLKDVDRRMRIVRLGQDVDRTGRFHPQALERTLRACREYGEVIREQGVERLRFVATSATRDAENREEFIDGVVDALGVRPEVISGAQEARFSFDGATKELTAMPSLERPFLVVDIGGGSTEFVLGDDAVRAAVSVDVGCVRMTERHLTDADGRITDPPTRRQIDAIRADVEAALDLAAESVPLREARTMVGLAGSVTTVAGLAMGLDVYESAAIHHSRVTRGHVQLISERLLASTHEERAKMRVIHPGRVDVIAAGALILHTIMERTGALEVLVSEHDILDGIGWSCA